MNDPRNPRNPGNKKIHKSKNPRNKRSDILWNLYGTIYRGWNTVHTRYLEGQKIDHILCILKMVKNEDTFAAAKSINLRWEERLGIFMIMVPFYSYSLLWILSPPAKLRVSILLSMTSPLATRTESIKSNPKKTHVDVISTQCES